MKKELQLQTINRSQMEQRSRAQKKYRKDVIPK